MVCNGSSSVNILVIAETCAQEKKRQVTSQKTVAVLLVGDRENGILDQESLMALFHSHLYKFIDIYILEGGMNSSERKECSNLAGTGVFLYVLKGGMTS